MSSLETPTCESELAVQVGLYFMDFTAGRLDIIPRTRWVVCPSFGRGWKQLIAEVKIKLLHVVPDERGRLMEILRSDEEIFLGFGQLYMTTAYPGVIKAWRGHRKRVDTFVAVKGTIKLVLFDQRQGSSTLGEVNEFFIGEHNPLLVQVPNSVLHGYKCVGTEEAIVLNCTTVPYHPDDPDFFTVDPFSGEIPYDWSMKL